MPSGALLPHMSARLRTETIDALFVGAGGFERALSWIQKSDANYEEFFKLWAKGAARHTNMEIGVSEGVEALLEKLDEQDRASRATVINGHATEVYDAPDEQPEQ